ncbi:MAG TPA: DNA-directed RNA polymerase subunit beta [Candidatus Latescibacteria bacterium]|nr:DNA-directed RNA polymerase subunit beta [Candidatus Latescibacterota bacterium]
MPDLLEIQIGSYRDFLQAGIPPEKRAKKGLQEVFETIFPITDVHNLCSLEFVDYFLGSPKYSASECQDRNATYAAPLKARLRLIIRDRNQRDKVKEVIEQTVFLGELPLMTEKGSFIINGAERVVVTQLHRSPGVFFDETVHPNGKRLFLARIIPARGSWIELSTDVTDCMHVCIDQRRKMLVTVLLRALGFSTNEEILALFNRYTANQIIENSLQKDFCTNQDDAFYRIYTLLRPGEPPNIETARNFFQRLFFNPKRYDLGEVGRYRINQRLGLDIPLDSTVLHVEDFVAIIRYLLGLYEGEGYTDDIDHLGNRRVRSVGELLSDQFTIGLSRLARTIREKMSLSNYESMTPQELVNARTVSTVITSFFGSSQLSQFMDQMNPLAELTHKRRLSALGPGGLTRERAGFEVRDVHHTHYGRMCPIETPEGPNIGLITSLATYARVNPFGFIEAPYRKVVKGRVTNQIEFLSADLEDKFTIAQANAPLREDGTFARDRVRARRRGDFPLVLPSEVDYMDVSPKQLVGVTASLIPFLEHDDASRALMGSNMQRQAVPLLKPEAPLVGTGLEHKVAVDSKAVILAEESGVVVNVTADRIVIEPDKPSDETSCLLGLPDRHTYRLVKFKRSNSDSCVNQRPLVRVGDRVKAGEIIADGQATDQGELALGANVLVAFMPWEGYNFEDAIVVSDRLTRDDVFTSIHIEEFELQVRRTRLGPEEITRDIPNVSEDAVRNLDERGVIRVGAEVRAGDILVGKVTPKGETELSPEEKLLRTIFGEKAGDVRDTSLRVPPGMEGVVIGAKVFSRKQKDEKTLKADKERIATLKAEYEEKIDQVRRARDLGIKELLVGEVSGTLRNVEDDSVVIPSGELLDAKLLERISFDVVRPEDRWVENDEKNNKVVRLIELAGKRIDSLNEELDRMVERITRGDELPAGVLQLVKVYVAQKRKLTVGDKMAGRHGNKGVVAKVVPMEDMPYLPDGTPVDIVLNPLGVPSRMNLGQILETHLGWAAKELGIYMESPVFDGASLEEVENALAEARLPKNGKTVLYDGRTGEKFDQEVTVGYIYMMKLSHLVEDKIHARSIGPYSLVTQQPLGGKAQFGGQRFGEMEVWALEAYGVAHLLQEMLTVKSDDVQGRSKVYEALVKGENPPEPGIPESFNVLMKELQSLALDIRLEDKNK